jgi:hypothetical protein
LSGILAFYRKCIQLAELTKMPIKSRKTRNDSLTAQRQSAQCPDMSTATGPRDALGVEHLGNYGLAAYDQLFRSRAEWTAADLALIAQAARAMELIDQAEREMVGQPMIVKAERTAPKPNPLLKLIAEQRATIRICLRDAHLRLRDGTASTALTAPSPTIATDGTDGTVTSFDAWLK